MRFVQIHRRLRRRQADSGRALVVVLSALALLLASSVGVWCGVAFFGGDEDQGAELPEATAWLRVEEPAPYLVEPSPLKENLGTFIGTQCHLIMSPLVLEQVLARPDIARIPDLAATAKPMDLLANRLTVRGREGSELLLISCQWSDQKTAALITNAVVEAYFKMHSQDEVQRATRVIEMLEDERSRRGILLRAVADSIRDWEERDPTASFDPVANGLKQSALRESYLRLQQQRDELALKRAELQVSGGTSTSNVAVTEPTPTDSELVATELREKAVALRQDEVLQKLKTLESPARFNSDLYFKYEEFAQQQETFRRLTKRISRLRDEMRAPTRISLLRSARGENDEGAYDEDADE